MDGRKKKKKRKGGKIKEEGIRGRETVVLFSLVWHYLSLLINPLRPSAWRSDENRGRGGRVGWRWGGGGCTWKGMSASSAGCWRVKVSSWCHRQARVLPANVDSVKCRAKHSSDLKSTSTMGWPPSDLLYSLLLFLCEKKENQPNKQTKTCT